MALTFSELTRSASNTDGNSYTTASVTLTAGRLYLVGAHLDKAAGVVPTSVATTGGAVSFASTGNATFGTTHNVSLWWAVASPTVTDTILISLPSTIGGDWSVVEVAGAASVSPIVQSKAGLVGFSASITVTMDTNLAVGSARYSYAASGINNTLVPTSGTWTGGTTNNRSTPVASGRAAWNEAPTPTQKSVIWTPGASANQGAVIVEIKAASDWSVGMIPL